MNRAVEAVQEEVVVEEAQVNPWLEPVRAEARTVSVSTGAGSMDGNSNTNTSAGAKGSRKKSKKAEGDSSSLLASFISSTSTNTNTGTCTATAASNASNKTTTVVTAAVTNGKAKGQAKGKASANASASIGVHPPVVALATAPAPAPVPAPDVVKKAQQADRKPLLMQKSQADLVQMAFAGPDLEAEFLNYKDQAVKDELGFDDKRKQAISVAKPGWGDWAGPGAMMVSDKIQRIRDKKLKALAVEEGKQMDVRGDRKKPNVMVSERRVKTAAKYVIDKIPHPFTSREEYERSIQMPIGEEWNASNVVASNIKPDILTRSGRIIEPIKLPKKRAAPDQQQTADSSAAAKRSKGQSEASTKKKSAKIQ